MPYHNWNHALSTAQSMFAILMSTNQLQVSACLRVCVQLINKKQLSGILCAGHEELIYSLDMPKKVNQLIRNQSFSFLTKASTKH